MKFKDVMNDIDKRNLLIMTILLVLLIIVTIIILLLPNKKNNNKVLMTNKTSTTTTNILKGYVTYEVQESDSFKYDFEKKYTFTYGDTSKKTIELTNNDLIFTYEISIKDGNLLFQEQRYNEALGGLEYTKKDYTLTVENKISAFLVTKGCDSLVFKVIVLDEKGNVYSYESKGEELTIKKVISNFTKVKTISKAKKIGVYNNSNEPFPSCDVLTTIYQDTSDNIRILNSKSKLFFDDAYYCYVGSSSEQVIIVEKDGKMKYTTGKTDNYLYDGQYAIKYRGSFYTSDDKGENIYIIGTDGYLYKIKNLSKDSNILLSRYSEEKITKIGTQTMRNKEDYATDEKRVIIVFEDNQTLEVENAKEFEYIK